jgi:hypothetical protein
MGIKARLVHDAAGGRWFVGVTACVAARIVAPDMAYMDIIGCLVGGVGGSL